MHSVLIHKSREDENVITYIYPLKKKQKHNHIILNRSQRIRACVLAKPNKYLPYLNSSFFSFF